MLIAVFTLVFAFETVGFAEAAAPATAWRDYASDSFASGTGSKDDPYIIETAGQLAKLSKDASARISHSGEYFKLANDIDLSAHRWNPIGNYKWTTSGSVNSLPFSGFLDGNGKTITGLIVDETTDKNSAGLFGYISHTSNKTADVGVKNLTVSNASITATDEGLNMYNAAILVAFTMTNDGYTIILDNVTVSGSVSAPEALWSEGCAGGLVANGTRLTVTNCKAENVSITNFSNCGLIAGMDGGSTYKNCSASGKINGLWGVGGFVGYSTSSAYMDPATQTKYESCIADVEVTADNWNAGGFAGFAEYGDFKNCAALGDVTSTVDAFEPKVGGFIGSTFDADVSNCHAENKVTSASTDYNAGGFIGKYAAGEIKDSSFSTENNPGLNAVGEEENEFTGNIEANSTSGVLSNICEDIYGGHNYSDDFTTDVEATCSKTGSRSRHCLRCDDKTDVEDIPMKDHEWDSDFTVDKEATCTENGFKSIHCKNCDATKDVTKTELKEHDFKWIIDKEATATEAGSKHEECAVCGFKKEATVIPATGSNTAGNIKTGDSSNALPYILVIAAVSALVIAGAIMLKRKKEN